MTAADRLRGARARSAPRLAARVAPMLAAAGITLPGVVAVSAIHLVTVS
ncbi:hypothetical protein [Dactylosporangium sp. NPDC048998]